MNPLVYEALPLIVRLCLKYEGLYLHPYLCPAGVPTIGVGSTRYLDGTPVRLTDPAITRDHAMVLLKRRLIDEFIPGVLRLCPAIDTPGRLAALVDFAYNLGLGNLTGSTLRRRVNAGRWADAPVELRKWVLARGKKLPGLVLRREAEAALI